MNSVYEGEMRENGENNFYADVETKIFDLGLLIDEYLKIKKADKRELRDTSELCEEINNMIMTIDAFTSQILLPKEIQQIYINNKLRYLEKYTHHTYYNTARRQGKIEQIYDDANEIAEITEYIRKNVLAQEEMIDGLMNNMAEMEEDTQRTVDEISVANVRTKRKMRMYRYLYGGMMIVMFYITYKVLR